MCTYTVYVHKSLSSVSLPPSPPPPAPFPSLFLSLARARAPSLCVYHSLCVSGSRAVQDSLHARPYFPSWHLGFCIYMHTYVHTCVCACVCVCVRARVSVSVSVSVSHSCSLLPPFLPLFVCVRIWRESCAHLHVQYSCECAVLASHVYVLCCCVYSCVCALLVCVTSFCVCV